MEKNPNIIYLLEHDFLKYLSDWEASAEAQAHLSCSERNKL